MMRKNYLVMSCIMLTFIMFVTGAHAQSDLIQFTSVMMKSVSSQINEATDLTTTTDNRAVLAALLTLEFKNQKPKDTIDFTSPIYVSTSGTIAAVSFNTSKGYVIVMYQMHPLSTLYGYCETKDPQMEKAILEMSSDRVWEVSFDLYLEKLNILVQQLQSQ